MSTTVAPGFETNPLRIQELRTTGQFPRPIPDIPICAVLLAIYFSMALLNLLTLKKGQRQHKAIFVPSGMQIGLCMSRVVALCLRLAWSKHVYSRNLAIAASIFVLAGVIVLEIVNMILLFRLIVRIMPHLERSQTFRTFKKCVYLFMAPSLLILVVVPGIQSQLVASTVIRDRDIIVLKLGIIVQACYCGIPLVSSIVLILNPSTSRLIRRSSPNKCAGLTLHSNHVPFRMWTMVLFNAFWLTFEQCFRAAQSFHREEFWLQSKPTFYCTIFIPEILVVSHNLIRGMQATFWHPYEQATGQTSQEAHGPQDSVPHDSEPSAEDEKVRLDRDDAV